MLRKGRILLATGSILIGAMHYYLSQAVSIQIGDYNNDGIADTMTTDWMGRKEIHLGERKDYPRDDQEPDILEGAYMLISRPKTDIYNMPIAPPFPPPRTIEV